MLKAEEKRSVVAMTRDSKRKIEWRLRLNLFFENHKLLKGVRKLSCREATRVRRIAYELHMWRVRVRGAARVRVLGSADVAQVEENSTRCRWGFLVADLPILVLL